MNHLATTIPTADGPMALYTVRPKGDGPFPAIVVIQHAGGVDTFTQGMAARLAEAGYFAAAPDLYHRIDARHGGIMEKMGTLRDPQVATDVQATVEYLLGHPAADGGRLGITGFCMGGRVAYLSAALVPGFRAVVAYYGGNIMKPWGDGPAPFDLSERLQCPLLFHFGADDANPSPADREKLDAELTRLGKLHEFHSYAGAGHAFMNFDNPDRHRPRAAAESWPRTLAFFAQHLA